MSNSPSLQSFIDYMHGIEKDFKLSVDTLKNYGSEEFSMNELFSESLEFSAATVLTQRMFIYSMERGMLDRIEKNIKNSNVSIYYNYANDFLDGRESPYRNLILFEIKCLIDNTKMSINSIERNFIVETSSIAIKILSEVMKKEGNRKFYPEDVDVKSIENYLFHNGLDRKEALKFCLAAMNQAYEGFDAEPSKFIKSQNTDKFQEFYEWILDTHTNDRNQGEILVICMIAFVYIFRLY